jgi:hypothetical protein
MAALLIVTKYGNFSSESIKKSLATPAKVEFN